MYVENVNTSVYVYLNKFSNVIWQPLKLKVNWENLLGPSRHIIFNLDT